MQDLLADRYPPLAMQLLGLIGASKLPGVVIPLLSQTVLIWQIVVGKLVLGRNLPAVQVTVRKSSQAIKNYSQELASFLENVVC